MICLELTLIWDIGYSVILVGIAFWYFRRANGRVPRWRQFLFGLGLALAACVLVGPIAHGAISTFWLHMVQHIALMMAISPLLVLGGPITVALQDPKSGKLIRVLAPYISFLFKPAIGFTIFLAALITTHFSPLANAVWLVRVCCRANSYLLILTRERNASVHQNLFHPRKALELEMPVAHE